MVEVEVNSLKVYLIKEEDFLQYIEFAESDFL